MKKILIVSATPRSNLQLAKDIAAQAPSDVETNIVVLEELDLPIYTPTLEAKDGVPVAAHELAQKFLDCGAFVLVAPEYNGSTPPVVSNALAWISRTTKQWRDGFMNKFAVVATMSAGGGVKVTEAMRSQLGHLGTTVHAHSIVCTMQKPLNPETAKKVLSDLSHWLR